MALRFRRTYGPIAGVAGILYAIPSLALFAFLFPITGLTVLTAEIGLVGYTLLILIRNIVAGVDGVPAAVKEAADGMGYRPVRRFLTVDLRLATPAIIAGVRIASVTTIGLVTVTFVIGFGRLRRAHQRRAVPQLQHPGRGRRRAVDPAGAGGRPGPGHLRAAGDAVEPGGALMDAVNEFWTFVTTAENYWGQRGIAIRLWDHLRSGRLLGAGGLRRWRCRRPSGWGTASGAGWWRCRWSTSAGPCPPSPSSC